MLSLRGLPIACHIWQCGAIVIVWFLHCGHPLPHDVRVSFRLISWFWRCLKLPLKSSRVGRLLCPCNCQNLRWDLSQRAHIVLVYRNASSRKGGSPFLGQVHDWPERFCVAKV